MFEAVKEGLVCVKTDDTFNPNKKPTPEEVGLTFDTANPIGKEPSNISDIESKLGITQEGGAAVANELTNDEKHLGADVLNNERNADTPKGSRFDPKTKIEANKDTKNKVIKYGVPKNVVEKLNKKEL